MKKIEAIIKPHRLEEVKERLREIGVSGMTISDVKGFGRTGGHREVYRGSAYTVDFVAKVQIEILVSDAMLHDVVSVIVDGSAHRNDRRWKDLRVDGGRRDPDPHR